jgi:hypothetical protein
MPARRNTTHRSNSYPKANCLSKKMDQSCFICTSSSQDHPLRTVLLNSTTLRAHDDCIWAIPELNAITNLSIGSTTTTLKIQNLINYQKRCSLVSTCTLRLTLCLSWSYRNARLVETTMAQRFNALRPSVLVHFTSTVPLSRRIFILSYSKTQRCPISSCAGCITRYSHYM